MSTAWNGRRIDCERNEDTAAARCMAIIDRGMKRLGMERAPARMNQILAAAPATNGQESRTSISRTAAVAAFLAEWRAMPEAARSLSKVARAHGLGVVPAKHVLIEAGLMAPQRGRDLQGKESP